MKKSLVLELQEIASSRRHVIMDVIRKALVVARKLKLSDFSDWLNSEMNGYMDFENPVPDYRKVRAYMRVVNPFHGLQPFFMPSELERRLCDVEFRQGISVVVDILNRHRDDPDRSDPKLALQPEEREFLLAHMEIPLEPVRLVSLSQLDLMVNGVRNTILDWSLKLEEEGILGEGMTFSRDEKKKAADSQTINITNFQGVLGDVSESEVTQNLQMQVVQGDFNSLRTYFESKGIDKEQVDELEEAIKEDPPNPTKPKLGPRVAAWVGKMVGLAAAGAWAVASSAAGGLLTNAIWSYYIGS